jgi:octaprenyl-diphosphate synthase
MRMLSALAQLAVEKESYLERTQVSIHWEDVASCVEPFLGSVRSELSAQSHSFVPELSEISAYALSGQGKLLRPAVFALSGFSCGTFNEHAVKAATVVEMIHLASLIHDDVIDGAETRRERPTLSRTWGNRTAILLGDCVLAQAAFLSLHLGNQEVSHKLLSSARCICIGETLQSLHYSEVISLEEYFKVISLKTGELFALAAELGALFANAPAETASELRQYGLSLGTSYQIYDDCVDIFSTEQVSGKSLGTDLSSGKRTLPILLLLEQASESEKKQISSILDNGSPERTRELLPFLKRYSILQSCISTTQSEMGIALRIARSLPPSEAQQGLTKLPQFLSQQFEKLESL